MVHAWSDKAESAKAEVQRTRKLLSLGCTELKYGGNRVLRFCVVFSLQRLPTIQLQ